MNKEACKFGFSLRKPALAVVFPKISNPSTRYLMNNLTKISLPRNYHLIIIALLLISSCASSGSSSASQTQTVVTPIPPEPITADLRHEFVSWTETYSTNLSGYTSSIKHKFDMTNYTTIGLPASTEKYKIADYGFFRSTITGTHAGYEYEDTNVRSSFPQYGQVIKADLNGDGWQDFYMALWTGNDRLEFEPNSYLFAFLNDGDGNFVLSNDLFPEGNPCFRGAECDNNTEHQKGLLVEDFNGDGIDDIYQGTTLVLSDNGKFYDKGDTHLPMEELFNKCMAGQFNSGCFSHDADTGDADGDGDMDIFTAISSAHVDNYPMGWAMLINDGSGNFTANKKFPTQAANVFATAATIGDFDNDGHGDVAVGWFKTEEAAANGFAETYENSAGAVFWNDGNNDWRNRGWTELPNTYYGTNGNANDIKAFDFNGDGLLDIILASTKHDPYYDGRAVQFFLNNGDETFSDVTNSVNPNTKYVNGLCPNSDGPCYWNGEGNLEILDFDGDGDLDIVDTVFGTYALINKDGTFSIYDDFPKFNDYASYFPVEIDNKYFYDFIASTSTFGDTESVQTFFQVLDPPLMEMMLEITNKPKAYIDEIFKSKMLFTDLRQNQRSTSLFAKDMKIFGMAGYAHRSDTFGFSVGKLTGDNNGRFIGFDYVGNNLHFGINYIDSTISLINPSKYYGTGSADIDYSSVSVFVEQLTYINDTWYTSYGVETYHTNVNGFTEQNSTHNVAVNTFSMSDGKLFADITGKFNSRLGKTHVSLGYDLYRGLDSATVRFADILEYDASRKLDLGKFSVLHRYNSFYARASVNTTKHYTFEAGFLLDW